MSEFSVEHVTAQIDPEMLVSALGLDKEEVYSQEQLRVYLSGAKSVLEKTVDVLQYSDPIGTPIIRPMTLE